MFISKKSNKTDTCMQSKLDTAIYETVYEWLRIDVPVRDIADLDYVCYKSLNT